MEFKEKKTKNVENLLGDSDEEEIQSPNPQGSRPPAHGTLTDDLLDIFGPSSASSSSSSSSKPLRLSASQGNGMEIRGEFTRKSNTPVLALTIGNQTTSPMTNLAIQFNTNSFCVASEQPSGVTVPQNQSTEVVLKLSFDRPKSDQLTDQIQIAMKDHTSTVRYFAVDMPYNIVFDPDFHLSLDEYKSSWKQISFQKFSDMPSYNGSIDSLKQKFESNWFKFTASRSEGSDQFLYFANKAQGNLLLLEIKLSNNGGVKACIKAEDPSYVPLFEKAIAGVIQK